jgi:hypothetical protein
MAVENFEQILQSINNSELRIALEKLFALVNVGTGSDGSNLELVGNLTGDVTGNVTGYPTLLKPGSSPVNAVLATCMLTIDTQPTVGKFIVIGTRTYVITTDGTAAAEGEIDEGADVADFLTLLLRALDGTDAWETANTQVTYTAWVGDTLLLTAPVRGVIGNAIVTTMTEVGGANDFSSVTLVGGVDGTVGDVGTTIFSATTMYIAKSANTIADANWRAIPLPVFNNTGAAPETISEDRVMGDTDFDSDTIFLDGSVSCTLIEWTPTLGRTYVLECIDSTADPVVTLTSGITVDGTNDTMTFPDATDTMIVKMVSATRMVIIGNIGGVTLS